MGSGDRIGPQDADEEAPVSDETALEDPALDNPVLEAAAGWVARLSSSDATDADRAAFEVWRAADPAHAAAHAEMDALWHRLGQVSDPRRRRTPGGLAGIAAVLVLSGAILGGAISGDPFGLIDRVRADLRSGVGEIGHATLADGSRIDLNTDTAVALRFTDAERGIELLRGEAFFDVAPDPGRPFVVRGNGLRVRAVGTRFVVRADDTDRPVSVAEGRVDVATTGPAVRVSGGEAVRRRDGALAVVPADPGLGMGWRAGRLTFSGERLSMVLAELGRYRHGRIVLLDAGAGERRVSGSFDPRNTDEALDVLAATMAVRVTRLTPLLVLVGSPL